MNILHTDYTQCAVCHGETHLDDFLIEGVCMWCSVKEDLETGICLKREDDDDA